MTATSSSSFTPSFNTRLGTPSNLAVGGTYDILLVGFPDSFPEGSITFTIDDNPKSITGIQKVAQLFLKMLFTTQGSNVLYPTQGTNFGALVIQANITTSDTLFLSELASEIKSAESQTKYYLNNVNADVADQLDQVNIIGMDLVNDKLVMYLQLLTKAGELAQIAIPFPQLDMALSQ